MIKYKKITLSIIAIGLWICSCVEHFNLNIKSSLRLLTVEATFTDSNEEQIITITESVNSSNTVAAFPMLKVTAGLLVNGVERVSFIEKGAGKYTLPKTFQTKACNTYRLFFTRMDGTQY